jgi:hypothetical protein
MSILGSSERTGDYNAALALFGIIGAKQTNEDILRAVSPRISFPQIFFFFFFSLMTIINCDFLDTR